MISLDTALAFFTLSLILGFAPGPDNIFVLMQSATEGRRAGMVVVLGLCAGLVVHTLAIALGLAAVFASSATAFTVLKIVGAAYLVYLAWGAFRAPTGDLTGQPLRQRSMGRLFVRGLVMNLTNPKVVFFFLALLPQFVQPGRGSVSLQLMALGGIFIAATLLSFGSITVFAAAVSARLKRSPQAQRVLNWVAGTVFLGMAARLAISER